eukprot:3453462-Amphidinium_carterae.1
MPLQNAWPYHLPVRPAPQLNKPTPKYWVRQNLLATSRGLSARQIGVCFSLGIYCGDARQVCVEEKALGELWARGTFGDRSLDPWGRNIASA